MIKREVSLLNKNKEAGGPRKPLAGAHIATLSTTRLRIKRTHLTHEERGGKWMIKRTEPDS